MSDEIFEAIDDSNLERLIDILENDASSTVNVNLRNKQGDTPLHRVIITWKEPETIIEAISTLLKHGSNVNIRSGCGIPIINDVCWKWRDTNTGIEMIRVLLEYGADVKMRDPFYKSTPLHKLCQVWGYKSPNLGVRLMNLLIKYGADVNGSDSDDYTPLHILCTRWHVSEFEIECVKTLLKNGADVSIRTRVYEYTPLDIARGENPESEIVKLLEEYSRHVRVPTLRGLVIRKIRCDGNDVVLAHDIPKMCLEYPDELQSSKVLV